MKSATWGAAVWEARPGREDEFVERWRAIAEWTLRTFPGSGPARLIEDVADPQHFISFFPWRERAEVEEWQRREEFTALWQTLEEVLVSVDRRTYELRLELGPQR